MRIIVEKDKFIFYATMLGLTMLEISFMSIPGTGGEGGASGSLAHIKFTMYILFFCIIVFCLSQRPNLYVKPNRASLWAFAYIGISILSLVLYSVRNSLLDLAIWARVIGLSFLIPYIYILNSIEVSKIMLLAFLPKLIPVLMIIALYFLAKDSVMREIWLDGVVDTPRLGGDVIPPNTLGGMLGILIIMLITYFFEFKRYKFIIITFFVIVFFLMLYMSQSRMALVATCGSLLVGHFLAKRNFKSLFGIMLFSLAGMLFYMLIYPLIVDSSSSRLSSGLTTFGGRLPLWTQGLSMFFSGDIINMNFGYGYMLPDLWFYTGTLRTNSLHNGYLQVLLGTGILGLLFYLMIWYSLGRVKGLVNYKIKYCYYSLLVFSVIFNITELGGLVLVNSMTLTTLALIGLMNRSDIKIQSNEDIIYP